jgi:hypothetical protein
MVRLLVVSDVMLEVKTKTKREPRGSVTHLTSLQNIGREATPAEKMMQFSGYISFPNNLRRQWILTSSNQEVLIRY